MNCKNCGDGLVPSDIEMVCIECEHTEPTPPHIHWVLNEQKRSTLDVHFIQLLVGIFGIGLTIIVLLGFLKITD